MKKAIWNLTGLLFLLLYIFSVANLMNNTYIAAAMDVYFVVDVALNYSNSTYFSNWKGWLILDTFLAVPYCSIIQFWRNRPAVKLITLKESTLFSILSSKQQRQELLTTMKEFFMEAKLIKAALTNLRLTKPRSFSSTKERLVHSLRTGPRIMKRLEYFENYSELVQLIIGVIITVRLIRIIFVKGRPSSRSKED